MILNLQLALNHMYQKTLFTLRDLVSDSDRMRETIWCNQKIPRVRFARSPNEEKPWTEFPATRQLIKPATYDGSGSWQEYRVHFKDCTEMTGWGYTQKELYLAVPSRGSAQDVLGSLPKGSKPDYQPLEVASENRFATPSQTELFRV